MARKPWVDEEELYGGFPAYDTSKQIAELFGGAHLYAMKASNKYLKNVSIKEELNIWYSALKRIYVATISLISEWPENRKRIEEIEEEYLTYFENLVMRPDVRKIKMHIKALERKCIDLLNEMQIQLTETLQKWYFFFRMKEGKAPKGLPQASEDLIKILEKRGFHVVKKTDKHN